MEKLIEDIIARFEQKKEIIQDGVVQKDDSKDKSFVLLSAGQIIAFDFCINELKRLVEYHKEGKIHA
jgi:hypothetical protein